MQITYRVSPEFWSKKQKEASIRAGEKEMKRQLRAIEIGVRELLNK